ncbi:hypothetical protein GCM10011363_31590 [Marivita lacus]|uniref:Uncharacterized protein n=1 Tax=Marivita lacus TaxID=1323742 RepID=A0ABQ1KXM0_9RHOB|nr:hypothetical protein GCM10011363_31590 [Marivita lacus]
MATPPQIINMSLTLSATGTWTFTDPVAATILALCTGQALRTGDAELAEHGEHGNEHEEENYDLADHIKGRTARTRRALRWR